MDMINQSHQNWYILHITYFIYFLKIVNELVSNYIAPLLVASGGSMEGVATVDDIQTAAQESDITRTRGCFLGGAGINVHG